MVKCPRCFMVQERAARCISCGSPLVPGTSSVAENPYAAPRVESGPGAAPPILGQTLASRLSRLGAQFIDLGVNIAVCIPGIAILILGADPERKEFSLPEDLDTLLGFLLFLFGILGFNIFQWILLARDGQTVGKKALGIRIIRNDTGGPAGFGRAVGLRVWVNWLLTSIPCYIGFVYSLIDVLFIFGDERRCVHDYIAGTKVITA